MKRFIFIAIASCFLILISACGNKTQASPAVVASTAWTAAYVRAAGIGECAVLAPYEMQHPAEYELRPGDVKVFSSAKMFVYAGYETMLKGLSMNLAGDKIVMVKIDTDFDPEHMKKSILAIADAAGTREAAERNITSLERTLTDARQAIQTAGGAGPPAVVHAFQAQLAGLFGLKVLSTFGPAPLEAKQIVLLTRSRASLVVDNWHNPVSRPLRETLSRARFVELLNFPGKDGTRTLEDVIRYDRDRLLEALRAP